MKDVEIKPMDERDLLAVLREEERDAASFYSSELASDQATAMERYYAAKYGDEVEGRSAVVSHDVEDTINWMMPHLMRLFIGNDELVSVEDDESDDPEQADNIGEFLTHVFFKGNAGEEILHDFAFDGLLQRIGVVRVAWEDPKPSPPKRLRNIPAVRLQEYLYNPEYEILAQDSDEYEQVWELEVRHTPSVGKIIVEQVPPEEVAFSKHSMSIAGTDYHRRKSEEFVADLCRQFRDKAHELDPSNYGLEADSGEDDLDSDPRRQARHEAESYDTTNNNADAHKNRRKVDLMTEYVRIDYDGDGIVELRQIKRVGNTILENIEVEASEFIVWSPVRISHKLVGRSIADMLEDIQKIRTVVTRKLLDSLSQSLAPRRVINKSMMGDDGVDQLLDHDIGDVIECQGNPREAIFELVTPDVSPSAYQALEYFDQRAEEASGVTRHAQGLKAEAITDTARGIEGLQAAANSRIELVGRWLGHGVERIFARMYKLAVAHQDAPKIMKIGGKPTQIDPRLWSDNARVSLHIGQAAETREAKLAKLNIISQKQEQILMQAGPDNPISTIKEYRETLALMAREAGFKSPERFFKEIPEDYQPPQPQEQEDPKLVEVKAKMQLAQAEAQAKAQLSQAEAQQKAQQNQAQMQFDQQMNGAKLETDKQIAEMKFMHQREMDQAKLQSEREIAAMRIQSEQELAYARMNAEMELARWRTEQELDLAKSKASADANLKQDKPGGRLDA